MRNAIKAVLGKLFKIPESEVDTLLLKADGSDEYDEQKIIELFEKKDAERIAAMKEKNSTTWKDALAKATKEVWQKVENKLKDRFEIESDLQGEELIDHVSETLETKSKSSNKKASDLSDEELKKHPAFIKAEREWNKTFKEREKELNDKITEIQRGYSQKEVLSKVFDIADNLFAKEGEAILPSSPELAKKTKQRLLFDELSQYDWQEVDGKYVPFFKDGDKKGQRVEDAHGHALDAEGLSGSVIKSNFEFKASKDRHSPASGSGNQNNNNNGGNGQAKKYQGAAPKNAQEYLALLTSQNLSVEERSDVKNTYSEQFSKDY